MCDLVSVPTLIVMVGIPGSGKSFKAKELGERYNAKIFSSDEYRERLCGDASCQEKNGEVFSLLYKELKEELTENKNCILDATNTTLKSRTKIFTMLRGVDFNAIAYVMTTPISTCIARDLARPRCVSNVVIEKFYCTYEHPQLFEGFQNIILDGYEYSSPKFNPFRNAGIFNGMHIYDQMNPHHIHTLGEHCIALADMYEAHEVEYIAGLFHDIGKLLTQSIDEDNVAHYYSHDCKGTYYLLSNLEILPCRNIEEVNEVLFFINYHMRAHRDFLSPKAMLKYKNIFGEKLYARLIHFAECDKIASGTYNIHEELKRGELNVN